MANVLSYLRAKLGRASKDEEGSATIPFVIFLPLYMLIVTSSIEMGMLMVRHVMLERGLDLSVRGLRLGFWNPPTSNDLKRTVCNNAAIIPDCFNQIRIELRPVDTTTWQPLSSGATCVDRSAPIQPADPTFDGGFEDQLMLVRACVKFKPLFPTTGAGFSLPKDAAGEYALIAASAFVNEPDRTSN